MKAVEYKKPINTIPDGVWESSRPQEKPDHNQQCTLTTDLQGNGYPTVSPKNHYPGGRQSSDHCGLCDSHALNRDE